MRITESAFLALTEKEMLAVPKICLAALAVLLLAACGTRSGDAFDTPEEAVKSAFAERDGEEAAASVRFFAVRPWQDDLIVFYDATASADRGEWQYQARVGRAGGGWVEKVWLSGGSKHPCNHAIGVAATGQPYIVRGRVCAPDATRVRFTWRVSGDTSFEELLPDGRFVTVRAGGERPPLAEALDEEGNVVAILNE